MKTLGKLKITPQMIIKKEELINLKGGRCTYFTCNCDEQGPKPGWEGTWEMCYDYEQQIIDDLANHCMNGGYCDNQW
jgi:hypothetical protein